MVPDGVRCSSVMLSSNWALLSMCVPLSASFSDSKYASDRRNEKLKHNDHNGDQVGVGSVIEPMNCLEQHTLIKHFFVCKPGMRNWGMALALLLLMAAGAVRAESIRLTAVPSESLGLWASFLVEEGPAFGFAEAQDRQQAGQFRPGTRPVLTFGIGPRPVWVRLELINPTERALPFRLTLGTTWIDQLDVYVVHDGQVTSWQTGDSHPNAYGLTPATGFVFSPLFAPGRSELYLRAQTADPLVLPIELLSGDKVAESEHSLHYSYGFLYGFLIALAVYNGVLYAGLRKRSYLYYALYLFGFILTNLAYTGHGYAWWWSGEPRLQRYIILVLMVLQSCLGLLFASRFLNLAQHAPLVLRWVQVFAMTGLGLLGLSVALGSQYGAALLAFNFVTLFTLLMVVLGVLMVRRGQTAGRYFLAATLCGMLGMVMTAFAVWGWIPFKPLTYHSAEIGILVEATLLALALAAQVRHQEVARQSAEHLARLDALTGLHNRRSFSELAQPSWNTAERNGRPLSLIMLDIDHFKQINDRHGHGVGDQVLIEISRLLTQSCRAGDVLSRWGGEEFVMLLPETDLEQACALAERIRQVIAAERLAIKRHHIAFTASLGVAEYDQQASLEALMHEADMRLYAAKANGRNQVCSKPVQPA